MSHHRLPTEQVYQLSVNETGSDKDWFPIGGRKHSLVEAIYYRDRCVLPRYNKRQLKKLQFRITEITTTEMFVDDLGNPRDNATADNEIR